MFPRDYCNGNSDSNERFLRYKNNKLLLLRNMKEMLERKMAALDATIAKLEEQIARSTTNSSEGS